jgi:hypothetical protein
MVATTLDGASVNFGHYREVATQMKTERPWLITMHCALHRLELALGDSLKKLHTFDNMHTFLVTLFYLFKRSGKLKRCLKATARALDVQVYIFPKVHGTRFVAHSRRGVDHLLKNWLPLAITIESMQANRELGKMGELNAKLLGVLKRLRDCRFLAVCCYFKKVLDVIAALSLKLEKNDLLVLEVWPMVEMTISRLRDLAAEEEEGLVDELFHSPSVNYQLGQETDDVTAGGTRLRGQDVSRASSIECELLKWGDGRKSEENRGHNRVGFQKMTFKSGADGVVKTARQHTQQVIQCIEDRLDSFNDGDLYKMMIWLDPAFWNDKAEDDVEMMNKLAAGFEVPLQKQGFDGSRILREWKDLRILARNFYSGMTCRGFWKKIFQFKAKAFPNICLLAELVLCIPATTGVVESGFSHLTALLNDRRLSTKHSTMENLLLLKVNNINWTEKDRDEIIDSALDDYMSKRRVLQPNKGEKWQDGMPSTVDVSCPDSDDDDDEQSYELSDPNEDSDTDDSILSSDDDEVSDEEHEPDLNDVPDVEPFSDVLDPDHSHLMNDDDDMTMA